MKLFNLILVTLLSVAMLTGCGGGGGGGGGSPTYVEPTADAAFLANAQYAGIVSGYSAMTTTLVDSSDTVYDPADNSAALTRSATFLGYVDDTFKTDDNKDGKGLLKTYMDSRLHRYTFHKFTFIPTAHRAIDDNTVEVTTHIFIHLVKKKWSGGVVPGSVDEWGPGSYEGGDPVVVWKRTGGVWRIISGLPKEMYSSPS